MNQPTIPIRPMEHRQLRLTETEPRMGAFALMASEELVGQLTSPLGSQARAQTADGQWHFRDRGFFRRRLTIEEAASGNELGTYHFLKKEKFLVRGELILSAGERFGWGRRGLTRGECDLVDGHGHPLATFCPAPTREGYGAEIEVTDAGATAPRLSLLLLFGCYLLFKHWK